ncbi:hypothetical protein E2562_033415 [Oryza meyeriana var. granulata]|uniref:Uncharacterized protein n=1 Tax=Oryza meyeriana var. granulata TaxID=110450 RepID=A0A6G1CW67_9ORYZ|nr:hypothetical protein E2562_033415 [Oryza meyeriana var. granulata]
MWKLDASRRCCLARIVLEASRALESYPKTKAGPFCRETTEAGSLRAFACDRVKDGLVSVKESDHGGGKFGWECG